MRRALYVRLSQLPTTTPAAPPKRPMAETTSYTGEWVCMQCRNSLLGGLWGRSGSTLQKKGRSSRSESSKSTRSRKPTPPPKTNLPTTIPPPADAPRRFFKKIGSLPKTPPDTKPTPPKPPSSRQGVGKNGVKVMDLPPAPARRTMIADGDLWIEEEVERCGIVSRGTRTEGPEKSTVEDQLLPEDYLEGSAANISGLQEFIKLTEKSATGFTLLKYESDFSSSEPKLVDKPAFKKVWELWKILLLFRYHLSGDEGVKIIWKGIRDRGLSIPTHGSHADTLWGVFSVTAREDEEFAQELIEYALFHSEATNHHKYWPQLYDSIMLPRIRKVKGVHVEEKDQVLAWHWRLFPVFSSYDWVSFFSTALEGDSSPRRHTILQKIHTTLNKPNLYAHIMKILCDRQMFNQALHWNKYLLEHHDLPQDSSAADPLVRWASKYNTIQNLKLLLWSFKEAGVPLVGSTAVAALQSRRNAKEAIKIILEDHTLFPAEQLGDEFWYTLFEAGLDPMTIVKIAQLRTPAGYYGSKTVYKASQVLTGGTGVTIQILEGAGLLHDGSDLTAIPEVAVTDAAAIPNDIDGAANTRIQFQLNRNDLYGALDSISRASQEGINISHETLWYLSRVLLRERRKGMRPSEHPHIIKGHTQDVDILARTLIDLKRTGMPIMWNLWTEVIKRLGMTGNLDALETLLITLLDLLHDPAAPVQSKENPLRKVFEAVKTRAFVEWGIIHGPMLWGVWMLRQMKEKGLHVDERSIQRAVFVRVVRYGDNVSITEPPLIELSKLRQIMKKVERTWGGTLWEGGATELMKRVEREHAKLILDRKKLRTVWHTEKGLISGKGFRSKRNTDPRGILTRGDTS
ncbi:hypothetical protein BZA77DRAFT_300240 [Pyronema omphalodes]|nr:hypothetical protein BZA77DRAFT_300240 [Pyronema omphalodes]